MQPWPLRFGKFLFKFRSFTPLPLIALTFIFFKPLSPAPLWTAIGLIVAFAGEGIRMISVGYAGSGTSGRESFLKAESLNTTGLYSLARNPLYWGNTLIFAGLLTMYAQPLALVLFIVFLFLQYHFIVLAEEEFLLQQHGQAYADYRVRVNRWLPRTANYLPPGHRFDGRKVFFKENDSCFNLLMAALLILAWKDKVFSGRLSRPWFFAGAALALAVFYAWVKVLKKKEKARSAA
ncbi:MAG: isoprenylcysteine carboxylmethyltransferase family protein [Candidatus Aminicenantes bacterium]|nr:isoprenylcysteine carboxylmethyltransferase family protein [Candidatus Aminicenantes bacterium]